MKTGACCYNVIPSIAANREDFANAIRLFYDKQSVAEYNIQKLQSLNKPIARINAIHNNSLAKPDEAGGLYPVLYLASNAQVMLTANLWPQVGLRNGAAGYIEEILYSEGQQPPSFNLHTCML